MPSPQNRPIPTKKALATSSFSKQQTVLPSRAYPPRSKKRATARRLFLLILIGFTLVLGTLLGTETGRIQVIQLTAPKLAHMAGFELNLTGVSSPTFAGLSVQSITLAQIILETNTHKPDSQENNSNTKTRFAQQSTLKPILQASNLSLSLSDVNIAQRFLKFGTLTASEFTLENLPQKQPKAHKSSQKKAPWQITFENIQLQESNIKLKGLEKVPELTTNLSISGDLRLFEASPVQANIRLRNNAVFQEASFYQELEGVLRLSQAGMLTLAGTYQEPEMGSLNQLLKRPSPKAIQADYSIALDLNTFKPAADNQTAEPVLQILKLNANLLNVPTELQGKLRFKPEQKSVVFEDFQVEVEQERHPLVGEIAPATSTFMLTLKGLPLSVIQDWVPEITVANKSLMDQLEGKILGKIKWQKNRATPAVLSADLTLNGKHAFAVPLPAQTSQVKAPHPANAPLITKTKSSTNNTLAWLSGLPETFELNSQLVLTNGLLDLNKVLFTADCLQMEGNGQVDLSKRNSDTDYAQANLTIPALTSACIATHFQNQIGALPFQLQPSKSHLAPAIDTVETETDKERETTINTLSVAQAHKEDQKPYLKGEARSHLKISANHSVLQGNWLLEFKGALDDKPIRLTAQTQGSLSREKERHNIKNPSHKTPKTVDTEVLLQQKITMAIADRPAVTFTNELSSHDADPSVDGDTQDPNQQAPSWHLSLESEVPENALYFLPHLQGNLQATLTLPRQTKTAPAQATLQATQATTPATTPATTQTLKQQPALRLRARGKFDQLPFKLNSHLLGNPDQFRVNQTVLSIANNGPISLTGNYNKQAINFQAKLNQVHLPEFEIKKWQSTAAKLSGLVGLRGTLTAPILQANLTAELDTHEKARPSTSTTPQKIPKQIAQIFIDTDNDHFVGDIQLRASEPALAPLTVSGTATHTGTGTTTAKSNKNWGTLGISVPRFALNLPLTFPQDKPAAATLWVKLSEASSWFTSTEETLLGELVADMQIPRIATPEQFTGFIRLNRGSYENRLLKVLAEDIHLYAERTGQDQAIDILGQANDGRKGRYRLRGALPWPPQPHAQHTLALTLEDIQVGYRNALSGKTTGTLTLAGDYAGFALGGEIKLQPTLITLENLNSTNIATLNPAQIHDKHAIKPLPSTASDALDAIPPVQLNVDINAPQQAYLRGRGLEAELAGKLKLTGTLKAPALKGQFSGVRGDYKIFGRKFTLEDSNVQLDGDNVIYQLSAEHKRADVQIQAQISGSQEQLSLQFSSIPELPEDEIIAYLLFGKAIDRITPAQAIQLAGALQQLRPNNGGGSGFDPLGKTRDLIQVDTLTVESQTEEEEDSEASGGVTIGIGKYINDRVYVEFLKDSDDSKSWRTNVEVEIAPSLDLKTNAESGRGFSGLELQWHRDY